MLAFFDNGEYTRLSASRAATTGFRKPTLDLPTPEQEVKRASAGGRAEDAQRAAHGSVA